MINLRRGSGIRRAGIRVACLLATAAALAACNGAGASAGRDFEPRDLRIMVPAAAGGGQDQLGRAVARVLDQDKLVEGGAEVFNVPGAGGIVATSQFTNRHNGDPQTWMAFSLGLISAQKLDSGNSINIEDDTTPIAELASEYNGLVVKKSSPLTSIEAVAEQLKTSPGGLRIGGAAIGQLEHVVVANFAMALGIEPNSVTYVPYESGGEQLTALMSGDVDVAVTGLNEMAPQIQAGDVRALAVTSPERLEGIDAPTFVEKGYGDDMVIANWRGLLAPPDISSEDRDSITEVVRKLHESPVWHEILKVNGWSDTYKDGPEFDEYFKSEAQRMSDSFEALGLAK